MASARKVANVKIGTLWKRSQNLSVFTRPNYRHRVFILTNQSLSYYGGTLDRVGPLKGHIEISDIRAVEYVEEEAFSISFMFQVVYWNRKHGFVPLYVIARDGRESMGWVDTLRELCVQNKDMLMHYHPGSYRGSIWTCCRHQERVKMGCQPTHALLSRSQSRYAEFRRRIASSNQEPNSLPKKKIGKSLSAHTMGSSTQGSRGTKKRSLEGGAQVSNSFLDITAMMAEKPDFLEAQQAANRVNNSTGEISDSCITLPVEHMEGVKEEKLSVNPRFLVAQSVERITDYSGHTQLSPFRFGGSVSSIASPPHLRLQVSASYSSIHQNSRANSACSQRSPLMKKASHPLFRMNLISPTPVPEEEVNELSSRRVEMELMTHTTPGSHSLSQPEVHATTQFQKNSHAYRSAREVRGSHWNQPQSTSKLQVGKTQEISEEIPMIQPKISDVHPCIIHL